MLMLQLSKLNPKNKDLVIVECESCKKRREQLYLVAKRKCTHICNSCSRSKNPHKTGEMVEYCCIDCDARQMQKYRPSRFKDWRCHRCAMVQGHKEGKFTVVRNKPSEEGRRKISQLAKERWTSADYREKWSKTRSSTIEKRRKTSKEIWADSERLSRLSESIRSVWNVDSYRELKSKQSQMLWQDADYIAKHASGMAKEDAKLKMADARLSQLNKVSSIQTMLYKYLDDLKVTYIKESEETKIGYYHFDCLIPNASSGGLLIECQGDYWHSLPRTQRTDRAKFTFIEKYHPQYSIMYVWEHEFYSAGRVLDRIKTALGIGIQSIDFNFSELSIREVDAKQLRSFLDSYHYIGAGRWGKAFGAFAGEELIGTVVFSSPLRQNIAAQFKSEKLLEISRVCIHPNYHKRNFASWLVTKTMKMLDNNDYVAYADTTVGHRGTIYKALGFTLHHEVDADYWYVDGDGYAMHKKTLYNRATKMSMTESEFAERNGYVKKFGGKKLCFIKYARTTFA